jgi:hypothetical protein
MLSKALVLTTALAVLAAPAAHAAPKVGEPAPAFTAVDSNGNQVSLADYRNEALAGKPVTMAVTRPYGCSVKYGP